VTGFSIGLTVACIVLAYGVGAMMNEVKHQRRRLTQCQQITQQVRDMRITLFTGGRK
jgi:hypothetical protein